MVLFMMKLWPMLVRSIYDFNNFIICVITSCLPSERKISFTHISYISMIEFLLSVLKKPSLSCFL